MLLLFSGTEDLCGNRTRRLIDATPTAFSTISVQINDDGDVAGTFSDPTGSHGFIRDSRS